MLCKFKQTGRRHFFPFEKTTNRQILVTSKKYQDIPRQIKFVKSIEPTVSEIEKSGDYACLVPIDLFGFDRLINTDLQADKKGRIVLNLKDAEKVSQFENPLKDPLIVSKLVDETAHLKDGFHRLYEAKERGYTGKVWIIVLDAAID